MTPAAPPPKTKKQNDMAKTGIHIRRCNVGSVEAHNKRTKGYIDGLKKAGANIYFFEELSRNNRSWVNPRYEGKTCEQIFKEMIEEYKALHKKHQAPALKDVTRINKKTGKEYTVAGWSPIREGVVPIKEDTKLSDFKPIEEWARGKGLDIIRIDMHQDEGYKDEETGNIKFNRHAHVVFDWLDHNTGKTLKLNEQDMRELQDVVANALHMERGESKAKTGAEHRDVEQQRIHADQQRIKRAEQKMQEMKKKLMDLANSIWGANYYGQDDYKEMSLEEVIESWQEDMEEMESEVKDSEKELEDIKNEIAAVEERKDKVWKELSEISRKRDEQGKTLYGQKKELEQANLSLSKAQKELETTNCTLEDQKRLISQINGQIGQNKLQLEYLNKALENFKELNGEVYKAYKQEESVFGVAAFEAAAKAAGKMQSQFKTNAAYMENLLNNAISRIVDFSRDARKRGFSQEDYIVFDRLLGKEDREYKAQCLIEMAEEQIGWNSYMGKNIVHRDIMNFASGNDVRLGEERGRGIGY